MPRADTLLSDPSSDSALAAHLQAAQHGSLESLGHLLQAYRNYLTILATAQLDRRLRRRMNPSDLVQEAMLSAHRDFAKFRGASEGEFVAWLRQILINCMRHTFDAHVRAQARNVRREVSLDDVHSAMDRSVAKFARVVADRGPSPSAPAQRREDFLWLANRLAQLRPEYREVIVLRSLRGLPFNEIAERMGRQSGTVRMLWMRAMAKLRHTKREETEP